MLADDIVDLSLVWGQRVEVGLSDRVAGVAGGVEEHLVGDAVGAAPIGRTRGGPEDADGEAGVAGRGVGDPAELIVGDHLGVEAAADAGGEDILELVDVVLVHPDMFARAKATDQPVVDAGDEVLLAIGDAEQPELREAMQVVEHVGILQLVGLVEDDDCAGPVVLLEPFDELVVGRRLAVDIDRLTQFVEDLVERPEAGVVAPAVDVHRLDVQHLLAQPLGDELREAGLARAARASDEGGIGGLALGDRVENAGEVIHFGVAMLDLSRDESGAQHASIADHVGRFVPASTTKTCAGRFRKILIVGLDWP